MRIILNYKKSQVQRFATAVRNNDKKTLKRICHRNCRFIGFVDEPGTLDGVLKTNLIKENTTVENHFWIEGKTLKKTSTTRHDVMNILDIEASLILTVKFNFKFGKIKTVEVTEWSRKMDTEDIPKWEAYSKYANETVNSKDFDILTNIAVASKYINRNK